MPAHLDTPTIVVLKFVSSVHDPRDGLADIVQEICREVRSGRRVVAVVSAFPDVADHLFRSAERGFECPGPDLLASYVATGETASAAILGIALEKAGIPARVVGPGAVGLAARGPHLDAEPAGLDVGAVEGLLEDAPVLVLPGFYGVAADGGTALFGRGGSDRTAIFVAERLGAECRLPKDVAALHPHDPASLGLLRSSAARPGGTPPPRGREARPAEGDPHRPRSRRTASAPRCGPGVGSTANLTPVNAESPCA